MGVAEAQDYLGAGYDLASEHEVLRNESIRENPEH